MIRRCIALAFLCAPLWAHAEVRPSDINRPVGQDGLGPGYGGNQTQWALELVGYFGTRGEGQAEADLFNFGPTVRIATPADRNEVEVVGALFRHQRTFTQNDSSNDTWRLSNLFVAHHWAWRSLARQFRLGAGITFPTARLPQTGSDANFAAEAYGTRAGMHGWRELWLFRPETLTVSGHTDYYWRSSSGLIAGGALVAGVMARTSDTPTIPESDVVVQAEVEVAYDTVYVRSALKAGVVALPIADTDLVGDDTVQIAVEPDFRIRLGTLDLVLRLTIPINKPAGFAFDTDGLWAVHLGVANGTQLQLPHAEDDTEEDPLAQ